MDTHGTVLDQLGDPKDGHLLTRAIIDTIREPLIILDENLRVIAASHSFYKKFALTHETTQGKMFYDLGNGQWNIPKFRILLEEVISTHVNIKEFEIEHNFPELGLRTMVVNAREIRDERGGKKMLLSIFDITHQRSLEAQREKLMVQKDLLLKEMRHRVANSLQLIASILLLKAESVDSEESRAHLEDAHERILSIATVQKQLDPVAEGEEIPVAGYLNALCKSLARSMIGGKKPITIEVTAGEGSVPSDTAVSFGLITTELVINALKHAFPDGRAGTIVVCYESAASGWTLSISDDGVGQTKEAGGERPGLGTSIVGALANQLQAIIRTDTSAKGTKVAIMHAAV